MRIQSESVKLHILKKRVFADKECRANASTQKRMDDCANDNDVDNNIVNSRIQKHTRGCFMLLLFMQAMMEAANKHVWK